jgi:hypothetical protein
LIHPTERLIRQGRFGLPPSEIERCATSQWDFDRIAYYLHQEHALSEDLCSLIDSIQQELEKLEAKSGDGSLMPLHYSIRALLKSFTGREITHPLALSAKHLLAKVTGYVHDKQGRDNGQQIRSNISALMKQLERS